MVRGRAVLVTLVTPPGFFEGAAMIGKAVKLSLPDTATFGWRTAVWVPTPGHGGDGILSFSQRPIKGGGVDLDTYAIEELPPERFGTRLFLVINLTDEDQEQPYRCVVGAEQRCSCMAGTKGINRTSCKHRDCLSQLTASGVLPTRELQGA